MGMQLYVNGNRTARHSSDMSLAPKTHRSHQNSTAEQPLFSLLMILFYKATAQRWAALSVTFVWPHSSTDMLEPEHGLSSYCQRLWHGTMLHYNNTDAHFWRWVR